MYHYVKNDSKIFPYSAHKTIGDFASEIKSLKALGFVFENPTTAFSADYLNQVPCDSESIILTFDDGLKDHIAVAHLLKELGVDHAAFYIPVAPYLTGSVLAVHKAQYIRSIFGPRSLDLLVSACRELGIDLKDHYINNDELEQFQHSYSEQIDDPRTKEFKRLINFYGDLGLRDIVLDKILEHSGLSLAFEDVYLLESEICEINSMGFEIGSHGLSHTPLARLDSASQRDELYRSKEYLGHLVGTDIRSFCYPYGGKNSYNNSTLALLKNIGYYNAISVEQRDISIDDIISAPYEIPRYDCNVISSIFNLS